MFNLVQPLPRFLPLSEGSGQIVTPQNSASYSLVLCSISAFPMHHSYYGTCLHLQPQEPVRSYTVLRALQLCFWQELSEYEALLYKDAPIPQGFLSPSCPFSHLII